MTWKLRPRPHRHDQIECWCELTPNRVPDEAWDGLAGFCEHGVGMLDQCDTCCPTKHAR